MGPISTCYIYSENWSETLRSVTIQCYEDKFSTTLQNFETFFQLTFWNSNDEKMLFFDVNVNRSILLLSRWSFTAKGQQLFNSANKVLRMQLLILLTHVVTFANFVHCHKNPYFFVKKNWNEKEDLRELVYLKHAGHILFRLRKRNWISAALHDQP